MKRGKFTWLLLLAFAFPLQNCGTGGSGSSNSGSSVTDVGLLAGSVTFTGPYPTVRPVTYTTTSNALVTVDAYPGQIVVHFDVTSSPNGTSPANISQREAHIKANNNGIIIGKIPLIGFYLVQVPIGQENSFIQAMISGGFEVDSAVPNVGLRRGISTPASLDNRIESGRSTAGQATQALAAGGLVPVSGSGAELIVIIDDFNMFKGENHGQDVFQTIVNVHAALRITSVTVTNKQLPIQPDGAVPLDAFTHSLIDALNNWAANSSASGQNITINLSWNVCEPGNSSCPDESIADYLINWKALSKMIDVGLKSVRDTLPDNQRDRFILVQEIGNADGLDISGAYADTYNAEIALGVLGNHLFVGGSDSLSNGALYATQVLDENYHNRIGWYPGCVSRNPDKCGSSLASPAVAALIAPRYALLPPAAPNTFLNFTASQTREAVLVALLEYLDPRVATNPSLIYDAAREVLNVSSVQTSCAIDGKVGGGEPSISVQPLPLDFMEALIGGQPPLDVTNRFVLTSQAGNGLVCNGTLAVSLHKQSATAWSFNISDTLTSPNVSVDLFVGWSAILPTKMTSPGTVATCGGTSSPMLNIGTPLGGSLPPGAGTLAFSFAGIALGGPLGTSAQAVSFPNFVVYPSGAQPGAQIGAYPPLLPSCGVSPFGNVAVDPGSPIGGVPVVAMYSHANYCSADGTTCLTNPLSTQANANFFLSVQ